MSSATARNEVEDFHSVASLLNEITSWDRGSHDGREEREKDCGGERAHAELDRESGSSAEVKESIRGWFIYPNSRIDFKHLGRCRMNCR